VAQPSYFLRGPTCDGPHRNANPDFVRTARRAFEKGVVMATATQIGTRFRTGETCPESGRYQFDGYTDGSWQPPPHPSEKEIPISRGEKFPPIRSSGKACYWKFMQRI